MTPLQLLCQRNLELLQRLDIAHRLVEHEPVFTLGQAGKPEHVLAAGDIPVVQVDRGGQVTYHGPGQIVAYPLFDLKRLKVGVRDYVCKIEQAMIDTLAEWNIEAVRKAKGPAPEPKAEEKKEEAKPEPKAEEKKEEAKPEAKAEEKKEETKKD